MENYYIHNYAYLLIDYMYNIYFDDNHKNNLYLVNNYAFLYIMDRIYSIIYLDINNENALLFYYFLTTLYIKL